MKKSTFYPILLSVFFVIISSCTTKTNSNKNISTQHKENLKVFLQGDTLHISTNSLKNYFLSLTLFDNKLISTSCSSSVSINVLEIIKSEINAKNDLSLYATKHNNSLPFSLKIQSVLDTTILFQIKPIQTVKFKGDIRGNCAPLISSELDENIIKNTKRWLYRKNEPLSDSLVYNMVEVLQELNRADREEYITTTEIPILRSFNNNKYDVTSNMIADHYSLFACSSQIELDDFVEEVVANNFSETKSSPNKITTCHKNETISGFNCIMLVGINNDWSYQIQPMGIIAVDNIPPKRQMDFSLFNIAENEHLVFKDNIKVNLPQDKPDIYGYTNLTTNDFGGDGVSCQVNFNLSFGGDAKSLTLVRSGNLAKWLSKSRKVINLQSEKSPYLFTYELHLEDGDNYVPIIVTDIRGNKIEYKMNIPESFTRNDPDVEIYNNIDIY